MRTTTPALSMCVLGLLTITQTACNMVPQSHYRQSLLRSQQLNEQAKALAAEREALAAQRQRLAQDLELERQRRENAQNANSELQQRYASLLKNAGNQPSPLSNNMTRQFEEFSRKYGIEFDPATGVSKFGNDILFSLGSDEVKPQGVAALKEFARIINQDEARQLKILVVGHTDDTRIARSSTRAKHPTNWHLSTDRANAVVTALAKSGIEERRMGVAGYSMYQPVVPNTDEKSKQRNRRVEIFVLAPDAVVAGVWDPSTRRE